MLKNKRFPNTILLHGGTGMGKCVTGNTLVTTEHGFLKIRDLVSSRTKGFSPYSKTTKVLNSDGDYELPEQTYYDVSLFGKLLVKEVTQCVVLLACHFLQAVRSVICPDSHHLSLGGLHVTHQGHSLQYGVKSCEICHFLSHGFYG
jgi:hypothetical protein